MTTDKTSIHWVREARDKLADARSFDAIAVVVNGAEKQVECYREDDGYAEECERDAAEIRLRARRRIAQLLEEKAPKQGARSDVTSAPPAPKLEYREAVRASGLSDRRAREVRQLARIPDEEFEAKIEARRAEGRTVSAAMFDNVAEQSKEEFEDRKALASVIAKIATLAMLDFDKIVAYSDQRELDNYVQQMTAAISTLEAAIGTIQAARRTHRLELVV